MVDNEFKRVSYTEAIEVLRNSKANKKKRFQYPVDEWGIDLQSEHERYLVEKHFNAPVILYNYPANIKAFYMRLNDDEKTVRAMDVLFPGIGEIVGGSQREERLDVLKKKMEVWVLMKKNFIGISILDALDRRSTAVLASDSKDSFYLQRVWEISEMSYLTHVHRRTQNFKTC